MTGGELAGFGMAIAGLVAAAWWLLRGGRRKCPVCGRFMNDLARFEDGRRMVGCPSGCFLTCLREA